jgi:ankyrin repeat protein
MNGLPYCIVLSCFSLSNFGIFSGEDMKNKIFFLLLALTLLTPCSKGVAGTAIPEDVFISYCREGDVEDVEEGIVNRGNVNARNEEGTPVLMIALGNDRIDTAKLLIKHGADVNASEANGWVPLHLAAEKGNLSLAKMLVEKGAKTNVKNRHGETPLHFAAQAGHNDMVEFLLAKGALINAMRDSGATPLIYAVEHPKTVKLLLDRGADPKIKEKTGDSILDFIDNDSMLVRKYKASKLYERIKKAMKK